MPTVQEIYAAAIRPLGESEKLQLATLILADVTQARSGGQFVAPDKQSARQRLAQFAGSVSGGNPQASDNEQIDRDLAAEYLARREDER